MSFFLEGLKEKVIIVPGVFFDVNPGEPPEPGALQPILLAGSVSGRR